MSIRQVKKESLYQYKADVHFDNGTTRSFVSSDDTWPNHYVLQSFKERVHRDLVAPAQSFGVGCDRIEYYLEECTTFTFEQTATRVTLQSIEEGKRG